ncbi:hypothetical protein AAFC00_002357 [Neodothiora populina]|uniref:Uncharacterized protein n=1 Tax=Neodothiora populina TaxID=2781224 RepID=A0ABR3PIB6_9PEZI
MRDLLSPSFKLEPVSVNDLVAATLVWGITLGFGTLTVWTAVKQTVGFYQRRNRESQLITPYLIMIWFEILVCLIFSIICWLYLKGLIAPSFAYYFCILTLWALQVQFLLQIIINRVSVLMVDRRRAKHLKWGVAALITAINISVYCIWIPARLQVSENYIKINDVWDRCEKTIYLVVDALLNIFFIRTVQRSLVKPGLSKYRPLVKFNTLIIGFSLSMDVLIISTMSLPNSFVYMQFHPLAYIVKLKIEMSMADLISSVARARDEDSNNVFLTGSDPAQTRKDNASAFNPKTGAAAVVKAFQTDSTSSAENQQKPNRQRPYGGSRHSGAYEMHNIPESSNTSSEWADNDHVPAGRFVVHRQDEVRMEFEDVQIADGGKDDIGHNEEGRRPHGGAQIRRGSDETPFVEQDKSYTQVWGNR